MIDGEQQLKGTLSSGTQTLNASLNGGNSMSGKLNNPIVETGNYNKLENKPSINNIELIGNVTLANLDIQPAMDNMSNIDIENLIGD